MSQAIGIAWQTVLNGLQTWVTRGSGLTATSVYWADQVVTPAAPPAPLDGSDPPAAPPPQNFARPPAPCIAMKYSIETLGQIDDEVVAANPNSNGHDGQEVLHTFNGQRLGTLTLTAYATTPIDVTGAVALLESVLAAANFPSIYDGVLTPSGIGITDWGKVQSSAGVINHAYNEPRATVIISFSLASQVAEAGTAIQTVVGQNQINDTAYTVTGQ